MKDDCDLLVVDDQPGLLKLLEELFSGAGLQVVTAQSGKQALALMESIRPRAVLLDLRMPGMDGLETVKYIREKHGELPVVLMTACDEREALTRAEELGVRYYLTKPFDLNEARSLVRELLKKPAGCEIPAAD